MAEPLQAVYNELIIPGKRFGGIRANKPGYHSDVDYNVRNHPTNYSIRYTWDKDAKGNLRKVARGLDITLSDFQMRRVTGFLRQGALENDPRMLPIREFYGTLDSGTVFGLITNNPYSNVWSSSSADLTHLWHIHESFWAVFLDQPLLLLSHASLLNGESLQTWNRKAPVFAMFCAFGDESEAVGCLQGMINDVGYKDKDGKPLKIDNKFGPITRTAVIALNLSSSGDYGKLAYRRLHRRYIAKYSTTPTTPAPSLSNAQIESAVARVLSRQYNVTFSLTELP